MRRFVSFIVIILVVAMFMTACGQKTQGQNPEQLSAQDQQQVEKPSDKLKAIETGIEKIIKALDGPSVGIDEEKSTGGTGQSSQQQGSQQDQQQGQTQGQTQEKDPWQEISPIINTLHYQWNDYIPDAVKKGADLKIIDTFSNSLNNLTTTIIEKDRLKVFAAANNLYASIYDLYSLYRTKISSEIKKIRYLIRNVIIDAMSANWLQADKDITSLKSSWSLFKNTLDKEQLKDSSKLDFSISELEKVSKEKNLALTDIKGRVALSNIEAIEKAGEKSTVQ